MTILMAQPAELTSVACRACGACCSFSTEWPRFSLESEVSLNQIPRIYVDDERGGMRCNGNRCAALVGDVGISTACAIYAEVQRVAFHKGAALVSVNVDLPVSSETRAVDLSKSSAVAA
jgi:hypothetical protein